MMARTSACDNKLKELEGDITCPICQEHYADPRFLPCNHYYCKKCILRLDNPAFDCPECRTITSLTKDKVDGLKPAFFVDKMKTNYTTTKELYKDKTSCARDVTVKKPSSMRCVVHSATLDIYCLKCKSLICKNCCEVRHITHKFKPTKKAAADKKKMLLQELNPLNEEKNRLFLALEEVLANKNEINAQEKYYSSTILNSFQELHKILEKRQQEMLQECEQLVETKLRKLSVQENDIRFAVEQIEREVKQIQLQVKSSTDNEVLMQYSEVQHEIKKTLEHCKMNETTAPVEEADIGVEVSIAQDLQTLCQLKANITTTLPECHFQLPRNIFINGSHKMTLTVTHPRKACTVKCRIKHSASNTVTWCEVKPLADEELICHVIGRGNTAKYSISCTPTELGEYEMIATVNDKDLEPQLFNCRQKCREPLEREIGDVHNYREIANFN